jgi:surface antigen
MRKQASLSVIAAIAVFFSSGVFADPPAHAPAHGWRKKHDPEYVGYTGTKWERDYDISSGRCNREEIGAVVGGVIGGAVGARTSSEENRTVAVIIGTAIGALVGSRIGRELDDADRGCFGHALEIGPAGSAVRWTNAATGVSYVLTPGAGAESGGQSCRKFSLTAARGSATEKRTGTACRGDGGTWSIKG